MLKPWLYTVARGLQIKYSPYLSIGAQPSLYILMVNLTIYITIVAVAKPFRQTPQKCFVASFVKSVDKLLFDLSFGRLD
jgi:hypothetical protein